MVEKVVSGGKEEFTEKLEEIKIPHHLGYSTGSTYVQRWMTAGLVSRC